VEDLEEETPKRFKPNVRKMNAKRLDVSKKRLHVLKKAAKRFCQSK